MIDTERIKDLAASLATDGYHMDVSEAGPRIAVVITAMPEACEDCLVPKELMRGMLSNELGVDAAIIDITYPTDRPGYSGGAAH